MNMAFVPVSIQMAQAYDLSSTLPVNMCAMSFALMSPPSDFLAVYLYGKYRTDYVLRAASLVVCIGALIRFFAFTSDEFWPILAGTFLMSSVNSLFLNSQIIIANKWFADKERAIAMSILNISTPIGQIVSFALTGYTFATIDENQGPVELDRSVIKSTKTLILFQNVACVVFFLLFQLVIKDKPDVPPSAVAAQPISEAPMSQDFKEMWANKNFMILASTFALVYGIYVAIGTTMSNLLNPFGYTPTQISIIGGSVLSAGVVGALLIGILLDYTSKYRMAHLTISVIAFAASFATFLVLDAST